MILTPVRYCIAARAEVMPYRFPYLRPLRFCVKGKNEGLLHQEEGEDELADFIEGA
jgi:hypothetical protein